MKVITVQLIFVSVLGQEFIFPPDQYVATPGSRATFTCFNSTEFGMKFVTEPQWLVNGSLVETLNLRNVTAVFDIAIGIGRLFFADVPVEYNGSVIACNDAEDNSRLLVQGRLSAVCSLTLAFLDSNISLTWTPPFTLDITGVNPDIEGYCVDIINSTTSLTLFSQCGITNTSFSYPLLPGSVCQDMLYTVTPVNVVGNGTEATESLSGAYEYPDVVTWNAFSLNNYSLTMSAPVCAVEVTAADLDTGEATTLRDITIDLDNFEVTFTTGSLAMNRLYNITVNASNLAGSVHSDFTISTHDVINATVSGTEGSTVTVTTVYSEHSDATGALFSFVFIADSGDVDFPRSALLALDRNASHNHTLPFNLYPGHYRVYVYDIEHDRALSSGEGYPAVRKELDIRFNCTDSCQRQVVVAFNFICELRSSSGLIWADCSCRGDPLTVITSFQVIAQLSTSIEVHKLYVNQSTDLQTPVTVLVERAGEYQVSVFAIREGTGILEPEVFIELVMVSDVPTTGTVEYATNYLTSTSASPAITIETQCFSNALVMALGSALGVSILLALVMGGVIGILGYKLKSQSKLKENTTQIPLDLPDDSTNSVRMTSQLLYEEIRDVEPPLPNIVVPQPPPETPVGNAGSPPEYEDVKPATGRSQAVSDSADTYHFTLCSAYGVSLDTEK